MVDSLLNLLDSCPVPLLPDAARLVLWSLLGGAASMGIYGLCSPQKRLQSLSVELRDTQRQLNGYDGELSGLLSIVQRNLKLALLRLGLAAGPSLIAGLPVIVLFLWLGGRFEQDAAMLPFGPDWMRSWLFAFVVVTTVSAIAVKTVFKIS